MFAICQNHFCFFIITFTKIKVWKWDNGKERNTNRIAIVIVKFSFWTERKIKHCLYTVCGCRQRFYFTCNCFCFNFVVVVYLSLCSPAWHCRCVCDQNIWILIVWVMWRILYKTELQRWIIMSCLSLQAFPLDICLRLEN